MFPSFEHKSKAEITSSRRVEAEVWAFHREVLGDVYVVDRDTGCSPKDTIPCRGFRGATSMLIRGR